MGLPNEVISGLLSSGKDEDSYQVSRSLRFNSADSAYLSRTPASAGNQQIWTYSVWLKRSSLETNQSIFSGRPSGNNDEWRFNASNQLEFITDSNTFTLVSTQVFRDISSWYHFVFIYNSPEATSSNRIRVYVNNVEITSWSTNAGILQNRNGNINTNTEHNIGRYVSTTENYNGYMTQIHFIDGQALDPTSFAQSDANGRWVPKAYSGTYGTNGFYLNFSDNSGITAATLGKDYSGNGNNWTPNNLSVTAGVGNDSFVDSPTNYGTDTGLGGEVRGNYATLNPIVALGSSGQSVNGNLDHYMPENNLGNISSIRIPDTGKWYAEFTCQTTSSGGIEVYVGVNIETPILNSVYRGGSNTAWAYYNGSGSKYIDGTISAYGASYTTNDVIGIAVNKDTATLTFYKNGVSQGVLSSLPTTKISFFSGSGGTTGYTAGSWNFGQRPFAYTAPTGFKALCTTNLPTPAIKNPSKYMNIVTYTGTGATRSLTGVGFQPDLVWTKSRSNIETHKLVDSIRGATKALSSETTGDEVTESGLTSFDSDGFTIDGTTDTGYNTNTYTYVGWNWKKGVTPGFDIVAYTGTGVARTISHSLGAVPHWMIIKARTTVSTDQGWPVYHRNLTSASYYILLNSTAAEVLASTVWNSTTPTSSVFSVGTNALVNTNNDTYVAYLWTEIEGFSRFGSYTANAVADGPFVWCGFRPRWIMIKCTTSALNWHVFDTSLNTYNLSGNKLIPNTNAAETTGNTNDIDILSNGFKMRGDGGVTNSGTIIFAAFAEAPFKYSRGR